MSFDIYQMFFRSFSSNVRQEIKTILLSYDNDFVYNCLENRFISVC